MSNSFAISGLLRDNSHNRRLSIATYPLSSPFLLVDFWGHPKQVCPVKARLHRRFCRGNNFCRIKFQTCSKPLWYRRDKSPWESHLVYTCDFGATKIASSCRDKHRMCKRALKQHAIFSISTPYPHKKKTTTNIAQSSGLQGREGLKEQKNWHLTEQASKYFKRGNDITKIKYH